MSRNLINYLILPQKMDFLKYTLKKVNFLIIKGFIGKVACVIKPYFLLKNKKLFFFFKKSLTYEKKKNVIGLLYLFLIRLLKNIQFGFSSFAKITGIGCTFSLKQNFLNLNVGLSHLIYYKIPLNIIVLIKGRKLNYIKVYGILNFYIHDCLSKIIALCYPNIYTGKGIFWYKVKEPFLIKIGKIKKI